VPPANKTKGVARPEQGGRAQRRGETVWGGRMPRSELQQRAFAQRVATEDRKDDKGAIPCERISICDESECSGRGS
jgi:hypothetical protein